MLDSPGLFCYYITIKYIYDKYSMADSTNNPGSFPPLSPAAFSILVVLKGGEKHGYLILREVAERTGGQVKLLPGTLYNLLKRMLEDGWIEELDERPDPALDDERRRYYRLSGLGERVLSHEVRRLENLVLLARQYGLTSLMEG
jgi:DNA-binding PadR family transcriptional regulator